MKFLPVWRSMLALAWLSCPSFSIDSINLDLEVLQDIDLSGLGTPNLDRFQGVYDVTVDPETCQYSIHVKFKKHPDDIRARSTQTQEMQLMDCHGMHNARIG
ncbi:MAG: hypothetical protein SGARI_000983 [Bacillariaceae sp.]